MVTFPYNTTDYAFTLNDDFINFSSANASYFTVTIIIKKYEFYQNTEETITFSYKIPLFNGVANWFVGDKIHRNIANLNQSFQEGFQLKTTLVSFEIKEFALADDAELDSIILNDVKFIAGHKPKLFTNNIGLLHKNTKIGRLTSKSTANVSFLLPTGNHVLKIYQNSTEISATNITATVLDAVYTKVLDIALWPTKPADTFTFKIDDTKIAKEFVLIPDTIITNTLLFIDSHKLLSSLALTGEYSFNDDFNQITHEYKQNQTENLEVIEVTEKNYIKINTGYILKNQVQLINEIFKIKKAFIKNIEGWDLELVPISKKRVGFDSEAFLYDYNLEFRINKFTDA